VSSTRRVGATRRLTSLSGTERWPKSGATFGPVVLRSWPFAIDAVLAKQGEAIYGWPKEQGGCAECHGIRPGVARFLNQQTWATPIQGVGTDTREYNILSWTAQSGVLRGAEIPFVISPLEPRDKSINILGLSVVGSILQEYVPLTARQAQARCGFGH
jgi:hypothetical protein